jgi:hypothetical protein
MKALLATAALAAIALPAQAGDAYVEAGAPGLIVGYGMPINDRFDWRVDAATLGSPSRHTTIGSIDYDARIKADRVALLADWFIAGGFYLSGGAAFHHAVADLTGHGNGGTITIGGHSYVAGPDDEVFAHVRFPDVMPYLGLGWRTPPSGGKGWGFAFDAGLSIGKSTVTGGVSGPQLSQVVTQQDIQQELDQVKHDADRLNGVPQLSFGATYRF